MIAIFVLAFLPFANTQPPEYAENLRLALAGDDNLLIGAIMWQLMRNPLATTQQIRLNMHECMQESCPADERLNSLINRARIVSTRGPARHPIRIDAVYPDTDAYNTLRVERVQTANRFLSRYRRDNSVLNRIVAVDEMWAIDGRLQIVVAYCRTRVLSFMFMPEGHSLTSQLFLEFIHTRLASDVHNIGLNNPIILMDNLRAHYTDSVMRELNDRGWAVWQQPRLSPDMMPCDIDLFPLLKRLLLRSCFNGNIDEIKITIAAALRTLNGQGILQAINNLPFIWQEIIDMNGEHRRPHIVTTPAPTTTLNPIYPHAELLRQPEPFANTFKLLRITFCDVLLKSN